MDEDRAPQIEAAAANEFMLDVIRTGLARLSRDEVITMAVSHVVAEDATYAELAALWIEALIQVAELRADERARLAHERRPTAAMGFLAEVHPDANRAGVAHRLAAAWAEAVDRRTAGRG
jgi:hypothetical protein